MRFGIPLQYSLELYNTLYKLDVPPSSLLYSGGTACGSRPGAVPASRPDADPNGPGCRTTSSGSRPGRALGVRVTSRPVGTRDAAAPMLRRRTIPHVRQSHNWDCGLACLEMTLRALGVPPSLCTLKQLQQKAVGAGGPSRTREVEVPPEFQSFWCAPAPTSYARRPARGRLHRSTGRAGR